MKKSIKQLVQDKKGANLVEYIALVALIALAIIMAVQTFGSSVNDKFDQKAGEVQDLGN
jgi:pilus assembly protein Flp/PilA